MTTERTIEPTRRRRDQARREGRFPRSSEITGVAVLLGVFAFLLWEFDHWYQSLGRIVQLGLQAEPRVRISSVDVNEFAAQLLAGTTSLLFPLGLCAVLVAVVAQLVQGGPVWNPGRLAARPQRIDPFGGLRQLLSWDGVVLGLLSAAAIGAGITAVLGGLWHYHAELLASHAGTLAQAVHRVGTTLLRIGILTVLAAGAVTVLMLVFRIWTYHKSLRMTPEEFREEVQERETPIHMNALTAAGQRDS